MKNHKSITYLRKRLALFVLFCLVGGLITNASTIKVNAQEISEAANNDSPEEAQLIFANYESAAGFVNGSYTGQRIINGTISSSDTDWFKLSLTGGKQYVTCNGASLQFFVYHENNLSTPIAQGSYTHYGMRAFEFVAPGTGTYFVKLVGLSSSVGSYKLMVGGPTYSVANIEFSLGTIQMNGEDKTINFINLYSPENAYVYSLSINNLSSSATKGVTVTWENRRTFNLSTYNMSQNVSVYSNVGLQGEWKVTIKYKKNTTIKPRMTLRFVYPVTSYLID